MTKQNRTQPPTPSLVLAELEAIVSRYPEGWKYSDQNPDYDPQVWDCVYVYDNKPCCLIGIWLNEYEGVSVKELGNYEGQTPIGLTVSADFADDWSTAVASTLNFVQVRQDDGYTWSEAISEARKRLHGEGENEVFTW